MKITVNTGMNDSSIWNMIGVLATGHILNVRKVIMENVKDTLELSNFDVAIENWEDVWKQIGIDMDFIVTDEESERIDQTVIETILCSPIENIVFGEVPDNCGDYREIQVTFDINQDYFSKKIQEAV